MQAYTSELWQDTLAQLKALVDEEGYSTWLQAASFHSFQDHRLVLSVPSVFYQDIIDHNYSDTIRSLVARITGEEVRLGYIICDPVSDGKLIGETDLDLRDLLNERGQPLTPRPREAIGLGNFFRYNVFRPRYSFDNFVVGESNRFAHAAAQAVADPHSKAYNPLFLYGGTGLGKTHLMHAIGHQLVASDPRLKCLYVTSEDFMNSFIDAISQNKQFDFRNDCRTVDLLLIDDVQFFVNKERTQTEFFHTFNALYDAGKKIIVSSDRPPKELAPLEERLRSRFEWGLIVDVQPPDLETRIAILKKKAFQEGFDQILSPDVLFFIADHVKSNIRELEGVLMKLKAHLQLGREKADLSLVKEVLTHFIKTDAAPVVSVDRILRVVCDYFALKPEDLLGNSRMKKFAMPRHIAQYLTRVLTTLSFPEIGAHFGGRDHTSVMHACKKIERDLAGDMNLKNLIVHLRRTILEGPNGVAGRS
ncbi:MAG: chromosomal replication initiator protein DnaA [bacterium]